MLHFDVTVDGHLATIKPLMPDDLKKECEALCSYVKTGSEFSPTHISQRFRMGPGGKMVFNKKAHWDGVTHLFKTYLRKGHECHQVPTGLLQHVMRTVQEAGHKVTWRACSVLPVADPAQTLCGRDVVLGGQPVTLWPYHYQLELVGALLKNRRAIVEAPTASGKSVVIAELLSRFPTARVLVSVPTQLLLHQLASSLEGALGEPVGRIGDGLHETEHRITVGIIKSLSVGAQAVEPRGVVVPKKGKKLAPDPHLVHQFLKTVDLWVADEVHLATTDEYKAVSLVAVNAVTRYGLSASLTRSKHDEKEFEGLFGPTVFSVSTSRLIQEGFLARPEIRLVTLQHEPENILRARKQTFKQNYEEFVVQDPSVQGLIVRSVREALADNMGPVLVLVSEVEHGQVLQELLSRHWRTAFLHGDHSVTERQTVIKQMVSGEFSVLIGSTIFDVGVDIPELRTVILAGCGTDQARTKQRVGRGLRLCARIGKKDCRIYDFIRPDVEYIKDHDAARAYFYEQIYPGCVFNVSTDGTLQPRGLNW